MQRRLISVAVAGVLGAPAVAFAQTSTVQIYGTLYLEYGYIDQGTRGTPAAQGLGGGAATGELSNVDMLQRPGSNIGFKGEEKLGGGLAAWFQCESTADLRGQNQDGFCSRNSALGLKGGFGSLYFGRWDTAFKRGSSVAMVGSGSSGAFGTTYLLYAGTTSNIGNSTRANFHRRQSNMVNYDSPIYGGFQVMAGFSTGQAGAAAPVGTAATTSAANAKPRVISIAAKYSAGPIYVAAGYERHNEFGPPGTLGVAGAADLDDQGWFVGAAYTWGSVRFGGVYTKQELDASATTESKISAWQVGVDWRIVGPHGLRAAYTKADDVEGNSTVAVAGTNAIRPAALISGAAGNTGAKQWQVRYVYTFSKRTELTFGYINLDNDAQGTYTLGGLTAPVVGGNNQDAWVASMRHRF